VVLTHIHANIHVYLLWLRAHLPFAFDSDFITPPTKVVAKGPQGRVWRTGIAVSADGANGVFVGSKVYFNKDGTLANESLEC
jgi:hypothetical protein